MTKKRTAPCKGAAPNVQTSAPDTGKPAPKRRPPQARKKTGPGPGSKGGEPEPGAVGAAAFASSPRRGEPIVRQEGAWGQLLLFPAEPAAERPSSVGVPQETGRRRRPLRGKASPGQTALRPLPATARTLPLFPALPQSDGPRSRPAGEKASDIRELRKGRSRPTRGSGKKAGGRSSS